MEKIPNIGLAQIDVIAGRPDLNIKKIINYINLAIEKELDILVFPEMAIPGYMIGDDWDNDTFIKDCLEYNNEILEASKNGICVIWGNIDADFTKVGEDGRTRKYNTAYIAQNGKYINNKFLNGKTYKTLLPNYREFDDKRYFYSLDKLAIENNKTINDYLNPFELKIENETINIGIMLCEDMWDVDYTIKPGIMLKNNGAEILINISCSPWTWRKNDKRHKVAKELIEKINIPMYYANNIGIQNNGKNIFVFDGASTIYDKNGEIVAIEKDYYEGIVTKESEIYNSAINEQERDTKEAFEAIIYTLKKYFENKKNKKVAIGLSGGIDSAVVASLLSIALGKENVYAVNMPSVFNSNTTKNAAKKLADNLDINYCIIPIQESYESTVKQIEQTVWENGNKLILSDLNKENIQARDRGSRILAAVSSAISGVFTNNGNKTETAFGYATLYGDVDGFMSVIGDLYKTQVYDIARYINKTYGNIIPEEIIKVVPSAELSTNQNVDEGKGDPIIYEYHDKLLYQWIEGGYQKDYSPSYGRRDICDILKWYVDEEIDERLGLQKGTVVKYFATKELFIKDLEEKWIWYKKNIFKRIQTPPVISLSKRAFGFDLRESLNEIYFTKKYQDLKTTLDIL